MPNMPNCPACGAELSREITHDARTMHVRGACVCGYRGPDPRVTVCARYGVRAYAAPYRCELCGDFHPARVLATTP